MKHCTTKKSTKEKSKKIESNQTNDLCSESIPFTSFELFSGLKRDWTTLAYTRIPKEPKRICQP